MPEPRQRETERSIDSSPPSSGLDRRLRAKQRLIKSSCFSEAFAQNRKWVGISMVLFLRNGSDAALRLGVVSSKKVGLRANKRNFARRRLREAYRNLRPYFTGNVDVVLVARPSILKTGWPGVLHELLALAHRAGLISTENLAKAKREHGLDNNCTTDC